MKLITLQYSIAVRSTPSSSILHIGYHVHKYDQFVIHVLHLIIHLLLIISGFLLLLGEFVLDLVHLFVLLLHLFVHFFHYVVDGFLG